MKRLTRAILDDYEIERSAPDRLCAVQFGDDAVLVGLVDRLIDDANRRGANVGVAVVQAGTAGFAKELKEQDGLFTAFVRGEHGDQPVQREQVVQSILRALDPDADDAALMALARDPGIAFAILHEDEAGEFPERDAACAALAARFLVERWRAGMPGMALIACGDSADCAGRLRARIASFAQAWRAGESFLAWLSDCRFFPALADCLVVRSGAEEAARLCGEMNYRDAMIHLAEPYGLWAIQADEAFRAAFPLAELCGQIQFVDDLARPLLYKHRLFDAGLFAMAALGCLHGDETLAECMKDEPLRELVGRAVLDEILPFLPLSREEAAPYVIDCFERYANPMNDNAILTSARGLIHKFNAGVLPAVRAFAAEHFRPPEKLTVALAATVLLYADARRADGRWETVVGQETRELHESPDVMEAFSRLSSDMDPESLAYAVLSDRELWNGADLREIDGLPEMLSENLAG